MRDKIGERAWGTSGGDYNWGSAIQKGGPVEDAWIPRRWKGEVTVELSTGLDKCPRSFEEDDESSQGTSDTTNQTREQDDSPQARPHLISTDDCRVGVMEPQ